MKSRKPGYIYIMSNKTRSTFYTGVTSRLIKRVEEHRSGKGSVFTKRYKVKYLVYFEEYDSIYKAIKREKQIKNWKREWKMNLIKQMNPTLRDLWYDLKDYDFKYMAGN